METLPRRLGSTVYLVETWLACSAHAAGRFTTQLARAGRQGWVQNRHSLFAHTWKNLLPKEEMAMQVRRPSLNLILSMASLYCWTSGPSAASSCCTASAPLLGCTSGTALSNLHRPACQHMQSASSRVWADPDNLDTLAQPETT